jgi:hypothetical protein
VPSEQIMLFSARSFSGIDACRQPSHVDVVG